MREKKYLIFVFLFMFLLMGCVNQQIVSNPVDLSNDESSSANETIQQSAVLNEDVSNNEWLNYEDAIFRIGFDYPSDWNLEVKELPGQVFSLVSKAVTLEKDNVAIVIQYEPAGEVIALFSGLGAGEMKEEGAFTFLDQGCMLNKLIYEGKTKMVWCTQGLEDVNLYVGLTGGNEIAYEDLDIDDFVIGETQAILATLYRIGTVDFSGYLKEVENNDTTTISDTEQCTLTARLIVNGQARVTEGLPNALRSLPGQGNDSVVLGMLEGGSVVSVLDGPVCVDGYYWWKVNDGTRVGWTAEGENGTYWVVPYSADQAVNGWIGTIVSAAEMAQVDDYFQMMDQNGSRYGIDGVDEATRVTLANYRDTGVVLQIWGTLYNGRMDAYNTQIVVNQLSEYGNTNQNNGGELVDGWVGVIVGMPAGAQYDDYFQMMDQNGTRHGIDGADDATRAALANYRDTGVALQVWGSLYRDQMDVYNTQIVVNSFVEFK
jgi:hypothetical protein